MRLLVRSWNLYHGRSHPQTSTLHLERMVRLVTSDAPDVVALQEMPLWAVKRLDDWSGMQASWAMTMPARLGPLARRVTETDPVRFRSALTGQANALLVNPHFELGRHRRIVLNPELSRRDWLVGGSQRRVCHSLEVEARGIRLVLANLHASKDPDGASQPRRSSAPRPSWRARSGAFSAATSTFPGTRWPGSRRRSTGSTRFSSAASSSSEARTSGPTTGAGSTAPCSPTTRPWRR